MSDEENKASPSITELSATLHNLVETARLVDDGPMGLLFNKMSELDRIQQLLKATTDALNRQLVQVTPPPEPMLDLAQAAVLLEGFMKKHAIRTFEIELDSKSVLVRANGWVFQEESLEDALGELIQNLRKV